MSTTKSIAKVPEKVNALAEIKNLNRFIDIETKKREIIRNFISKHLKEGEDYGKIHVVSKHKCPNYYNCKDQSHFSKNTLFKPGSEKFISLFHLKPRFKKDTDTWEMLGSKPGVVSYICELYNGKGTFEGEGRGVASSAEERDSTPNKLVKMAEKRAQLDAVLRTGGLSDFFTQDLEDRSQRPQDEYPSSAPKKPAITGPRKASIAQVQQIEKLLGEKGQDKAVLLKYFKIDDLSGMTSAQAIATMKRLNGMPNKVASPVPVHDAPPTPVKTEEERPAKKPALNFQVAWVKGMVQQLLEMKIITPEEGTQVDFMTEERFHEIQHLYKKQKNLE